MCVYKCECDLYRAHWDGYGVVSLRQRWWPHTCICLHPLIWLLLYVKLCLQTPATSQREMKKQKQELLATAMYYISITPPISFSLHLSLSLFFHGHVTANTAIPSWLFLCLSFFESLSHSLFLFVSLFLFLFRSLDFFVSLCPFVSGSLSRCLFSCLSLSVSFSLSCSLYRFDLLIILSVSLLNTQQETLLAAASVWAKTVPGGITILCCGLCFLVTRRKISKEKNTIWVNSIEE